MDFKKEIATSILSNNFEDFQKLVQKSSGLWKKLTTRDGNTLIQQLIKLEKPQFFRYLLEIADVEYLEKRNNEGQTAIRSALTNYNCSYALALVSKYDTIPAHYDNEKLLSCLVRPHRHQRFLYCTTCVQIAESLLKKGMNPNWRSSENSPAPLLTVLMCNGLPHFIFLFLLNGADPCLTICNYNAFELSAVGYKYLANHGLAVGEFLLEYTSDPLQTYVTQFHVLLSLAANKSPLFDRLIERDVRFLVTDKVVVATDSVSVLLHLETPYLKIILKRYLRQCRDTFRMSSGLCASNWTTRIDDTLLERISLIVESGATTMECLIDRIFNCDEFVEMIVDLGQTAATEIITFLCGHGLQVSVKALDLVYVSFGDCVLYRFLVLANMFTLTCKPYYWDVKGVAHWF